MSGYVALVIIFFAFMIWNETKTAERPSIIGSLDDSYESKKIRGALSSASTFASVIGIVCALAFGWKWWSDRHGLPENAVAVAAFIESPDGIGSVEGGRDPGYCYGPWGGIENSSPCVVLVSNPSVIERPDDENSKWCFEVTYLVETNKIDMGTPWDERTLDATNQYVSVCGELTLSGLNGNGTKHDYRSWEYKSTELVQDKIEEIHGF
jgi:hypothetical protein